MVICDFDIKCITVFPFEAYSPLVVNPDAVLSFSIATQFFKMIGRRDSQVVDVDCVVDHTEFPQSNLLNFKW